MKKFKPYENQMGYLVGGDRLPSTPGEMELEHKCNPHPNDWIDGIYYYRGRSQMTMKEKIKNPITVNQALELSKKVSIPIDKHWGDLLLTDFEKSILNRAEHDLDLYSKKRLLASGEYRDIISSCGGSDAPYFADKIIEPIEKFNATHFPDGREKSKAVTM